MPNPILRDNDRKVKVFSNGVAVSASPLQSVYSKYLNFINMTVTENAPLGAYDVTAGAATDEKVISYINGTQVGSVARCLNFSSDFTGSDDSVNGRTNIGLAAAGSILLPDGTITTKPKVGTFYGGAAQGDFLFSGVTINGTVTGEQATGEQYTVFTSPATDDSLGGISTPLPITRRSYNPTLVFRFKANLSTERIFLGLSSVTPQTVGSDTPLNSKTGVGVFFSDVVNPFTIMWNNTAGTQQSTATAVTKNTTVHTLVISMNDSAGTLFVSFDGVTIVNNTTTAVPASTTALYVHANMEAIGTTPSPLAINYGYIVQDK